MNVKELKENLTRDLCSLGYDLYDVTYAKNDKILHVIIDKNMDLNEIEDISKKVSKIMDLYDEDMDEYMLDVSSVGIERPIKSLMEFEKAIGSYIYIKTKNEKIYGDLLSLVDNTLTLKVKEKNVFKEIKVNYDDVKVARYAVKF